jgi:hypothetical protein
MKPRIKEVPYFCNQFLTQDNSDQPDEDFGVIQLQPALAAIDLRRNEAQ